MKDLDRKMRDRYWRREDDRLQKLEEKRLEKMKLDAYREKMSHNAQEKDGEDECTT